MSVASGWAFLILMFAGSGGGVPLGVPPLPEDPVLAKVAPEECLLYFSSAGMAKPDPKSTNQTEKLFAEPEIRKAVAELENVIRAGLKESAKKGNPQQQAAAEAAPTLIKALLTRPLAIYISEVKITPKGPLNSAEGRSSAWAMTAMRSRPPLRNSSTSRSEGAEGFR